MKLRQLIPTVDTNLEDISRNHFFFFSNLVQCGEFVSELSLENLKITLEQINSLKAKASTSERNQVHHYEILKTHMAFCVEGTVMIKKQITHTGRCRSRLNLSLQSSYFGNVMFEASLVALSCDLLSESLSSLIISFYKIDIHAVLLCISTLNMDAQFPSSSPGGGDTMKINTKESIIEALRKVLVPFYPVAGRLARDENGRIEINCNGEGVLFVVADTESTTEELGEFMTSMKFRQLIPTVDTNLEDISRNPLLLLQVTSFKCGGVCLGVGWHHTLADGTGALHFINSWATLARGLPITIPPLLDRTILRGRVAQKSIFHHVEYDPPPTINTDLTKNPKPQSLTNLKITLEQINSLKAKASDVGSETKYTTYEILTAHIWRSVSKARGVYTMKINTKESIIVRPSHDIPQQRLWVSNMDLLHPRYYLPTVYLYKPNGSSDFFEAEVIKEALRKVLVPFYPVAGRLARDENGRIEINCNGEGVLLVVADTDSTTEELGESLLCMKLRQLIPTVDTNLQDISRNPLLLLQVTSFKCGGVCLGVGWHHTLADGTGALHFINSWATLARGHSITIPPLLDRTILRGRVAPKPIFHHVEFDPPPTMNTDHLTKNPKTQSLANLKITLEQINSLKEEASNVGRETKYTTYEILTAHIWRSVSKARNFQSNDQKTKLRIAVDGRSRLDPPLQSSYFGNVIFTASPVALSGDLLSESFRCTVERIHREIKKMDAEYLRSALDYLEEVGDVNSIPRGSITCACPNLNIVSWMRLPIYKADFGWCPCMRPATMFEGKGYIHPDPANDGSFSLAICLEADHMESFRKLNGSWMRLPFYKADFGWGAPLLMRPTTMFEEKGYIHLNPANDGIFSLAICLEADHMESFRKLFYDF
uniref:Uncharacterized protein n=1 Tax=Salix viminalis TaxID=40686 RepID=A0A6N2LTB5_SALVM